MAEDSQAMPDGAIPRLSPQLAEGVRLAARLTGTTEAAYLANALRLALATTMRDLRGGMRPGGLVPVFAQATGWIDLQARLRAAGFVLRAAGRLYLHDWPGDRRLLPLAAIGQSEAALVLRFRAPFPAPPVLVVRPVPATAPGPRPAQSPPPDRAVPPRRAALASPRAQGNRPAIAQPARWIAAPASLPPACLAPAGPAAPSPSALSAPGVASTSGTPPPGRAPAA